MGVPTPKGAGRYITSKNSQTQSCPVPLPGVHPRARKAGPQGELGVPRAEKPGSQQTRGRSGPGVHGRTDGQTGACVQGALRHPTREEVRSPAPAGADLEDHLLTEPDTGRRVWGGSPLRSPYGRPLHRHREAPADVRARTRAHAHVHRPAHAHAPHAHVRPRAHVHAHTLSACARGPGPHTWLSGSPGTGRWEEQTAEARGPGEGQ